MSCRSQSCSLLFAQSNSEQELCSAKIIEIATNRMHCRRSFSPMAMVANARASLLTIPEVKCFKLTQQPHIHEDVQEKKSCCLKHYVGGSNGTRHEYSEQSKVKCDDSKWPQNGRCVADAMKIFRKQWQRSPFVSVQ